ncbi:unnamed protein product (mitochondrion) [Plasmodiophora brassicae]|uniref:Uncharacterized protein n=1 Tax=Plasmodiophora brassicae TaxID=37360 RepID=A0A0G4J237_PLABS|nr:hypothetical protein PBRA_001972 [Plasmodiophora brassicae]SPR01389.1 unnamed protein product [Plasmodiophora brassicae]
MQCLHVGGFVLRRDGNLAYLDCADAPTSSLAIEWASTPDAVDGVARVRLTTGTFCASPPTVATGPSHIYTRSKWTGCGRLSKRPAKTTPAFSLTKCPCIMEKSIRSKLEF